MTTKLFHGIILLLAACSNTYNNTTINEYQDNDGGDMSNLTRSATSLLSTTKNELGSFTGSLIPNMQIDDLEPGEYTIEFQVVEPPIDNQDFATYAYINWKVDGQQIQRIISVFSGAVIGGVAEAVDIQLQDQSGRNGTIGGLPVAAVTNGSPTVVYSFPVTLQKDQIIVFPATGLAPEQSYTVALAVANSTNVLLTEAWKTPTSGAVQSYSISPYRIAATLSKGTRPPIMQPPTLLSDPRIVLIAPAGAPQVFNITQNAGIINVLVTVIAGVGPQSESVNGWVDFIDQGGSQILGNFVPNLFSGWFPVPVGAVQIRFHNESATASLSFAVQWGIEG